MNNIEIFQPFGKNNEEFKEHLRKMKEDPEYARAQKEGIEKRIRDVWKELKPFKTHEDVPDIPNTYPIPLDQFYINRLIELGAIPKKDLKNGVWYYGQYRNHTLGQWNQKTQKFDHYRMKFGWRTDDCNHFEDDNGYALFVPLRKATDEELEQIKQIERELK